MQQPKKNSKKIYKNLVDGKNVTAIYINDFAIYMIDEIIRYDIFDILDL